MAKRRDEKTMVAFEKPVKDFLWTGMLAIISDMRCVGCLFTERTSQAHRGRADLLASFTNGHIFPHTAKEWSSAQQREVLHYLALNHRQTLNEMCAAGCVEGTHQRLCIDHVANHILLCDDCNRGVDSKFVSDSVDAQGERVALLWRWRQRVRLTPLSSQMVFKLGICTEDNQLTENQIASMTEGETERVAQRVMPLRDAVSAARDGKVWDPSYERNEIQEVQALPVPGGTLRSILMAAAFRACMGRAMKSGLQSVHRPRSLSESLKSGCKSTVEEFVSWATLINLTDHVSGFQQTPNTSLAGAAFLHELMFACLDGVARHVGHGQGVLDSYRREALRRTIHDGCDRVRIIGYDIFPRGPLANLLGSSTLVEFGTELEALSPRIRELVLLVEDRTRTLVKLIEEVIDSWNPI